MLNFARSFSRQCFILLVVLALLGLPLVAQDATGRIIGVVTDPSGGVITNAKVTVTNVATGISNTTTTGSDGAYQVLLRPIGSYQVTAEVPGFRKDLAG